MYGEPENKRYISDYRFTLEADQADALRQQFSSISPVQQDHLKGLAGQWDKILVYKYSRYFIPGIEEEVRGIAERIVVTKQKDYIFIQENWPRDSIVRSLETEFSEGGRMVSEGSIILLTDPKEDFEKHIPLENKEVIANYFGSLDFEDLAIQAELERKTAHELSHAYQYRMLPRLFFESGARYYGRLLIETLDRKYLTSPDEEDGINFYQSLIEKHGDWIHMMFFGGHVKIPGGFDKTTRVFDDLPDELYQRLQY